MNWFDSSALSLAVFLPLAGALLLLAIPNGRGGNAGRDT